MFFLSNQLLQFLTNWSFIIQSSNMGSGSVSDTRWVSGQWPDKEGFPGCKENHFYSLPFGQAESSIY